MTRWMPLPLSRPWKKRVRRRILSPPNQKWLPTILTPMRLRRPMQPQMPPQACRTILLPQTWRMIRLPQARKTHLRKLPHRKPRMILPPQRPIRIFWVTYWQRSLSKKHPPWLLKNPIS